MSMFDFQGLIGEAPSFRRLLNAARLVAATDASVLIIGEAGTGKESLAREIHRLGDRRDQPFQVLPVTGMTADDLVAALDQAWSGARGSSLFLDEVAELPSLAQARLLYWLAGPGGAVRLMAATRQDLWERVRAGSFREDLYYRLAVVPLELPPLRERVQDIPLLLEHFLALAAASGKRGGWAFLGSSLAITGTLCTAGFAMFPFIMPSSLDLNSSLTLWDAVSSHKTLGIMFVAACIFVPLILAYTLWCYAKMWGKVTTGQIEQNSHGLY